MTEMIQIVPISRKSTPLTSHTIFMTLLLFSPSSSFLPKHLPGSQSCFGPAAFLAPQRLGQEEQGQDRGKTVEQVPWKRLDSHRPGLAAGNAHHHPEDSHRRDEPHGDCRYPPQHALTSLCIVALSYVQVSPWTS